MNTNPSNEVDLGGLRSGDRVAWQYTRATNSRTRFKRVKHGTFIRYGRTLCVVAFDHNKTYSRVPEKDLRKLP